LFMLDVDPKMDSLRTDGRFGVLRDKIFGSRDGAPQAVSA
jgi:hypothetical protein